MSRSAHRRPRAPGRRSVNHVVACAVALTASGCLGGRGGPGAPTPVDVEGWIIGSYQPGTHSHNDFERRRPLAEALELGFASIEVDVALRDGELYVTHDSAKIDRSARFIDTYLEPLRVIAQTNGSVIYPAPAPPLQLLVDVKSDPGEAFRALDTLFARYGDLMTRWTPAGAQVGAVTVVVSGNRPREQIRDQASRAMALDGRIWEDRTAFAPEVMPLVSINWDDTDRPGDGWPDTDRMSNARRYIEQVHSEGRLVRFWNTPDRPDGWARLKALGADFIGTDDPRGLSEFMSGRPDPWRR